MFIEKSQKCSLFLSKWSRKLKFLFLEKVILNQSTKIYCIYSTIFSSVLCNYITTFETKIKDNNDILSL